MNELRFLHYDQSIYNDYTFKSIDYLRDFFDITYVIGDFVYIGLYKPFNNFYVEKNQDATGEFIQWSYYNGSFTSLSVIDDTNGFDRSGFISFEKPSDWQKSSIGGIEAYWIRFSCPDNFTLSLKGLNIVFSDDNDLLQECRDINNYLAKGDDSFIAYQVSARNDIVQRLRNGGLIKKVDNANVVTQYKNITKWDILDIGEIRQASKYLVLSKIFFDVSENADDKNMEKYREYNAKYGDAFELFMLSIDKNDDGQYEQEEDLELNDLQVLKQ
jgi:hypothetical protein